MFVCLGIVSQKQRHFQHVSTTYIQLIRDLPRKLFSFHKLLKYFSIVLVKLACRNEHINVVW